MLILFDPDKLLVNVQGGALEEYAPNDDVKAIVDEAEVLRKKVEAKQKEIQEIYQAFLKEEIDPAREDLKTKVLELNKRDVPGFRELAEKTKKSV